MVREPSALTVGNRAYVNAYTGVSRNNQLWIPQVNNYPKYLAFRNQLFGFRNIPMPTQGPILSKGTDHTVRGLTASAVVNDGFEELSYAIAPGDTCDCVTFPLNIVDVVPCPEDGDEDAYWGVFRVILTAGIADETCLYVIFDESEVYANCPSGLTSDQEALYDLCIVDFTEGTDTPENLPATKFDAKSKKAVLSTVATPPSLRHSTPGAKKTRIHLSVHRLLTFVVEAIFALQYPSV